MEPSSITNILIIITIVTSSIMPLVYPCFKMATRVRKTQCCCMQFELDPEVAAQRRQSTGGGPAMSIPSPAHLSAQLGQPLGQPLALPTETQLMPSLQGANVLHLQGGADMSHPQGGANVLHQLAQITQQLAQLTANAKTQS